MYMHVIIKSLLKFINNNFSTAVSSETCGRLHKKCSKKE